MLAHFSALILTALIFASGFSIAQRLFRLERPWDWILAYPIGMTTIGLAAYFLWLLAVPWNMIVILVTTTSVLAAHDIFRSARAIQMQSLNQRLNSLMTTLSQLEPLETLLLAVICLSGLITIAWHFFLQPVVWDTLVLYDFRARAINDGWQIEQFFGQFTFGTHYLYDFLHPYLSSLWQALVLSFGAPNSTFLSLGLIGSVLVHAAWVLPSRKAWIVFATLLLVTPATLTVWTQNYAVEPYFLLWMHIAFLVFAPAGKRPQNYEAITILFLICTMLLRVSEPYWLVLLFWLSWPIVRSQRTLADKFLLLALYGLPALAVFAHWGQLQQEAASWIQNRDSYIISTYDPGRYHQVGENLFSAEVWLHWLPGITVKNPLYPFLVLALGYSLIQGRKTLQSRQFWLFFLFAGMLFAAFTLDFFSDKKNWELKTELWARTGLPLVAVSVVLTALKIQPAEYPQPLHPGRKLG